MQTESWYPVPRTRKTLTKNSNLGNNSFDENVIITQILIQMLDVYENKIDHIKQQIDSGIKMSIVQVLSHLRDKYISLKKGKKLIQEPQATPQSFLPSNLRDIVRNVENMDTRRQTALSWRTTRATRKTPRKFLARTWPVSILERKVIYRPR